MKWKVQFSSDEMVEQIQFEDSTVEILGFIDEIEGPKIVGKTQQYKLLKFMINNNSQHWVQVVAWNKEIDRIEFHLKPNRIIHIDGVKCKKVKLPEFNHGTLSYELIIQSNTVINTLGVFNLERTINIIEPKLIKFEDIPECVNTCILIRGFIKTNFYTASNNYKTYGCGSITDGIYKLEIKISEFENNLELEKGQEIEVKGFVKISS